MPNLRGYHASVRLNPRPAEHNWRISIKLWAGIALMAILWLSVGSDRAAALASTRVATINTIAGNGTAGSRGQRPWHLQR
jgi:hypothetical protein